MSELQTHPAAAAFPMMGEALLAELTEDIRTNGLRVPVVLCDGKVLDGRNRVLACEQAGVQVRTEAFDGDPWAYVWSLNGQRRDLVAEQRYLIWKVCSENSKGFQAERQRIADAANAARSEAAKEQHAASTPRHGETMVQEQSVPRPKFNQPEAKAKAKASKTNPGAVKRGDKLAKDRPDLAEKVRSGDMKPAAAHREMKRDAHAEVIKEAAQATEIPAGPFGLVLADPPWRYEHQQAGNRAIENQYPTATVEDICKQTPDTADDAVLFLWATAPLLLEALRVMDAWGFTYRTHAIWDKEKIGMGYWFRGQHELLLVGIKGKPGAVPESCRVSSIFREARQGHSVKPAAVYEWIEKAFPAVAKLEMYSRKAREGWAAWGNEVAP